MFTVYQLHRLFDPVSQVLICFRYVEMRNDLAMTAITRVIFAIFGISRIRRLLHISTPVIWRHSSSVPSVNIVRWSLGMRSNMLWPITWVRMLPQLRHPCSYWMTYDAEFVSRLLMPVVQYFQLINAYYTNTHNWKKLTIDIFRFVFLRSSLSLSAM